VLERFLEEFETDLVLLVSNPAGFGDAQHGDQSGAQLHAVFRGLRSLASQKEILSGYCQSFAHGANLLVEVCFKSTEK